jgi:hypothetical protein
VISTRVKAGEAYLVGLVVQARAKNVADATKLALRAVLNAETTNGKITQVMVIPTSGTNGNGQIVQTLQISALFTPSKDNETIKLTISERTSKLIVGLVGNIQLTKIKLQPLETSAPSNLTAAKETRSANAVTSAMANLRIKEAAGNLAAKVAASLKKKR